ncbi:MAG: radical SAM protein [Clostridia bacterium]
MTKSTIDLEKYLSDGIEALVKEAIKVTLKEPKESMFMMSFMNACKKAALIRSRNEKIGEHIPSFLISSITSECNLHCKGCYSRATRGCFDGVDNTQMTKEEWLRIFEEAMDMGVSFILLAGGEPLIRKDVILAASTVKSILFPVFTNGTMITDEYLCIFDDSRNLLPVLSIEGNEEYTDTRRGSGIYRKLMEIMEHLHEKKIIFGASVTVTKDNLPEVTSESFIDILKGKGCKIVLYVEYVPVDEKGGENAFGDKERILMEQRLYELRDKYKDIIFISFPGDEKSSGGCLAAGRGFFHINASGGAEPCPFSPYSDINIRNIPLIEALHSPLFRSLNEKGFLTGEHTGGCVLFEKKNDVEKIVDTDDQMRRS